MNPEKMRHLILRDDPNQPDPQGGGTGVVDPPKQDPPPTDPPKQDPPGGTDIKSIVNEAVKPLLDKIATLEAKAGQVPPANLPPAVSEVDEEINLRKEQLAAVKRGEIDVKYEPEILSRLSAAQARKVGAEMVSEENSKSGFFNSWNEYLRQAIEEYPELKDSKSEIAIEAKKLVESDPSYRRYIDTIAKNPNAKIDFSSLDARVNLRAAREAAAIVQKRNGGKPLSQQPNAGRAKTGLESGRGSAPAPVANSELDKLEKEAVETGDPMAWQRLIKARDQSIKAGKQ